MQLEPSVFEAMADLLFDLTDPVPQRVVMEVEGCERRAEIAALAEAGLEGSSGTLSRFGVQRERAQLLRNVRRDTCPCLSCRVPQCQRISTG